MITMILFATSEAVRSSDDSIVAAKSLYIYLVTDMIWYVTAFTVFSLRDDDIEDGHAVQRHVSSDGVYDTSLHDDEVSDSVDDM